jgi:hypothetical protein
MTEKEWLTSADPEEMYFDVVWPLKSSRRRIDLFCAACARLVSHLMEDEAAKRAFDWLEEHPGQRERPKARSPESRLHVRELFREPARALYEAHDRREPGISGAATHIAFDLWADWYEYAFPNLFERFKYYPGVLRGDPSVYLPAVIRDIFGNPYRPVSIDPRWLTSTVIDLATAIYTEKAFDRLPALADALTDAGCDDEQVLGHCRSAGPHVRGCWVVDKLLRLE